MPKHIRTSSLWASILVVLAGAPLLRGQTSTGEIQVELTDPSNAAIPSGQIQIKGTETGNLVRSLTTNESGLAIATLLPPATYDVTASAGGFGTIVRKGIVLRVSETVTLRLRLEPGAMQQTVTVMGETPQLEEKSMALAGVVEQKQIVQLPLNGRNYLQLALLMPGAVPSASSRDNSFSAYGNSGLQNAFLLDGARNISYLRGLDTLTRDVLRPPLDAIDQFSVQLSNYSAQFGASSGGIVSVVTKSGTNSLHGSAYNFIRNNQLDAANYFAPPGTNPLLVRNQFGGSLGGPIIKNKVWLFGAYEDTPIRSENTLTSAVPAAEFRQGRFGAIPVFDPFSTRANPSGPGYVRQALPGNVIPASLISQTGQQLLNRYPLANRGTNFIRNSANRQASHNGVMRGDVQVSSKDSVYVRFGITRSSQDREPGLPEPAQTPVRVNTDNTGVGVGYTRTMTPTTVNEFRFSWARVDLRQNATMPRDEIIPGILDPNIDSSIPVFNVAGFAAIGAQAGTNNVPLRKSSGDWGLSNNLSRIQGRHSLQFGADLQLIRPTTFTSLSGRGSLGFTGVFSQDPQRRAGTGSPVADLLMGTANSISTGSTYESIERGKTIGFFAQDQWAITPTFTLTLGIRYELYPAYTEVQNRMANFILDDGDPTYGKVILAGDPSRPRSLLDLDTTNWAPRIGIAWKVPKLSGTVIRAAYGIFYAQDTGLGVIDRITGNPPFYGYGSQSYSSDQLFPASGFVLTPGASITRPAPIDPSAFVLNPAATSTLISWDRHYTTPYSQQWNLNLQKEIKWGLLTEVSYVGNRGLHFWGRSQANQPLVNGPGAPVTRRPLARYTVASVSRLAPWSNSDYHGMSSKLERRFASGLSMLASYTYGKVLNYQDIGLNVGGTSGDTIQDNYNRKAQRGPSNNDLRQRFVFSGIWDMPFGHGRKYASKGWLGHVVGPWQLNAIYSVQSGLPLTVTMSFDNANAGTTSWPNRVCSGALDSPSVQKWFDTACFVAPPSFVFGNSGRNIIRGPSMNNLDFGIHRMFILPFESKPSLAFRAEAFNGLNHPQFALPTAILGGANYGAITATSTANRQLQLSLRLQF